MTILLTFALVFGLNACKTQKGAIDDPNGSNQVNSQDAPARMVTITGLFSEEYCGGAPPSDEMVEEMEREKPFANQTLHIYTLGLGEGEYFKLKTDDNGQVKKRLKPGRYLVYPITKEAYDKLIESTTDRHLKECYRAHYVAPIAAFDIVKGDEEAQFIYRKMCNPCEEPRP